jgi:phospholipid/cholesterol/gamma-HCH transport system ATP-binding protein
MSTKPIIRLKGVEKSFGPLNVLKGIDYEVGEGVSSVIMGGSGSGKSVLIKHVVGLLKPDAGEVWVSGKRVDTLDGDELDMIRLSIGYLFQSGALFDSMSVFENMEFFLERHSEMTRPEREDRIMEYLTWVGLPEKRHHRPAELSGGQRKRIALARALVLGPDIMLYDEPTTGLDPVSVRSVSELIVRLREELGVTSVAITHDLLCAEIIADDVHFLYEGAILTSGSLEQVRGTDHPALKEFFGSTDSDP